MKCYDNKENLQKKIKCAHLTQTCYMQKACAEMRTEMKEQILASHAAEEVTKKVTKDYEELQKENPGILKVPKIIGVLGAVEMVFFGICMAGALFSKSTGTYGKVFCCIVFGAFILLGLFLVLYQLNYLVIYKKGEITYRNVFRITKKYNCREITGALYMDGGGIRFLFQGGRKLTFSKEESYFCRYIINNEKIRCKDKGEDAPVIKVTFHPFMMVPCWSFCVLFTVWMLYEREAPLCMVLVFFFCLACQLSYTTYDKHTRILTRTRCGFSRKYDMHHISVKKIYNNGYLIKFALYDRDKKVGSVPVSTEYKNRMALIHAIEKIGNVKK